MGAMPDPAKPPAAKPTTPALVKAARKPASTRSANPPADARHAALAVLSDVLEGEWPLDEALERRPEAAALAPRDRAFMRLLVATVLRRLIQLDQVIEPMLARGRPNASVMHVLRLGAAQLLFLDTPPHAAIDRSVALAEAVGAGYAKGMVNAVLRRVAAEGKTIIAGQDAARLIIPDWLWRAWTKAYGEAATRRIAEAHLAEPPLDVTLVDPAERATIADALEASVLPTGSLRRHAGGAVRALEGFGEGRWWVQDAAAALPVLAFGAVAGKRAADLCAAPGGKTLQLASRGALVTALDRSAARMARVEANLSRTGLRAETIVADATEWQPALPFDCVLLDAPCSATGTARRHPDILLTKGPSEVRIMAEAQDRLLDAALRATAPGGTIVYSVCSLQPEEGPLRVAALIERAGGLVEPFAIGSGEIPGAEAFVQADGSLRTRPCDWAEAGGIDGFYIARLRRRPE